MAKRALHEFVDQKGVVDTAGKTREQCLAEARALPNVPRYRCVQCGYESEWPVKFLKRWAQYCNPTPAEQRIPDRWES